MHPILFKIPLPHWKLPYFGELHTFPIYAYGVMLGLSLVVGWYVSLGLAKRDGLPRETMANNYVFTAVCAIIGARLLYIVTNLNEFERVSDYLSIRSGGLVAYGGFLGGFVGSWWFCSRKRVRLLAWADAAVPALASGLFFTRIGCYLFGCDFGKVLPETAPAWLRRLGTFPEWHYDFKAGNFLDEAGWHAARSNPSQQVLSGSPAWLQHAAVDARVFELHHSLPVHPTQIYESLCGVLLFGLLFLARGDIKRREAAGRVWFRGETFLLFTFAYGTVRFMLEMVRDDAERGSYGPHLEPHVLYPAGLMLLALAFVFGLSNLVEERLRVFARSIALLVPFALFLWMRPGNQFAAVELVQLSTSQWIALATGVAAAVYYRRGLELAIADPAQAADPGDGVPELLEMEAAMERGEEWPRPAAADAEDESPAPAKRKSRATTKTARDADDTVPDRPSVKGDEKLVRKSAELEPTVAREASAEASSDPDDDDDQGDEDASADEPAVASPAAKKPETNEAPA